MTNTYSTYSVSDSPRRFTCSGLDRRRFLSGLAAGAIVMTPRRSARAASESVSIALDWYPNSNHAGLYWAQSKGLFTDAGLDVDIHAPADPATVLQTVATDRDTFGISYEPDLLLARDQGLPVVAVASIVPRPLLGVMSLKLAGITRPSDLRGKTVGYPGIASQQAFLTTMLAADGSDIDEITLNDVEFNLVPSVISGQAAAVMGAYWTHETILAENQGYPVDLMRVEDWGVPLYDELVLVASEKTIDSRGDMVMNVVQAMIQGYRAVAGDHDAALAILQAASPEIDMTVEIKALPLLGDIWATAGDDLGRLRINLWDVFGQWMQTSGLVSTAPDSSAALCAPMVTAENGTPVTT
jgi:putative hydroxymethylpyrimidine transport system substrate-binding protein